MILMSADKVVIQGPQVDGGYKIIFYVGEYEQDNVASLMKLEQGEAIKLMIQQNQEESWQTKETA